MSSAGTISLFSDRPQAVQRPTSFIVSIVAHIAGIALLSIGLIYAPRIDEPLTVRKYTLRHLDLNDEQDKPKHSASKGMRYPGPAPSKPAPRKPAPGDKPGMEQAVLRQTAEADKGPQTLIQPDIVEPLKPEVETPVPTVVIWTPKTQPVKKVVAPLPEPATVADATPSIKAPNQELNLGDLNISSSLTPTDKLPIFPSTTTPLVVKGPAKLVQMAPVTTAQTKQAPTPTAVMSISDLRMPDGTATLPPVNQSALQNDTGILAPGQASSGHAANSVGGVGSDARTGEGGVSPVAPGSHSGDRAGSGDGAGEDAYSTEKLTFPKNGEFGAVVVGASLEAKYPEISEVWNGRVAYTVYLHVGLEKSWILQYSLPRSEAASSGNITRFDAPWPFNIVRPNIAPGSFNADAILVHGYISEAGRFEQLGLSFPPQFREAQFVLDALSQWQFRPAARDGQSERVEVLLIIPEEEGQ